VYQLASIDPGVQRCYVACWDASLLVKLVDVLPEAQTIVAEKPQIYPGIPRTPPNDLVTLALMLGRFTGNIKVEYVLPHTWKGQIKKPVSHNRIWDTLFTAERKILPPLTYERIQQGLEGGAYKWEGHNFLDAVGIGLWKLGRLRP